MSDLLNDLEQLAVAIESERGDLDLLALFRREDHNDWEMACSAAWAIENKSAAIAYLSAISAKLLSLEVATGISSIVILDGATAVLSSRFRVAGEYHDFMLNGVTIADAAIVRLRKPPTLTNREIPAASF